MSYEQLKAAMDTFGDYELIFVNDGSRDDTLSILKDIAATGSTVKVLSFSRNSATRNSTSMAHASAKNAPACALFSLMD